MNNIYENADTDKLNQIPTEQIDELLADNNLNRKRLPEEKHSLLKAVSDVLYFSPHSYTEIQQHLIQHLKSLISLNKLPPKLSMFRGNSVLLKDFTMSPHLPGFEKINLELVSSLYKVRVIIYGTTEDGYLSSMIINSKYTKTVELLRTKNNHYDPVYSVDHLSRAGVCQNIVLNIIEKAFNKNGSTAFKDFNKNKFINYEYKNWVASQQAENGLDNFRITRGRHKKSFSDNFTKNFETLEDNQMKIYNMFMNMKPPEDFLNKINIRKDTAESNFSINANLDFVDENWQDPSPTLSNQEFAIKNYPINSHYPKFKNDARASSPQPQRNRSIMQNGNYFRENLTLDELETLEKNHHHLKEKPPVYFPRRDEDPPRLTPTSYLQAPYQSFSEAAPKLDNMSPNMKSRSNQIAYPPQDMSSFNMQQAYPNPYMNRIDNERNMPMMMGASPFNRNQPPMMQFGLPQNSAGNFTPNVKPQPFHPDDGTRRYSGRLKFFDETKNYGFIVMDEDGSDIFVHFDDLMKANLSKDILRTAKNGNMIHLSFSCMQYVGKYNKSRKAVDIQLLM